MATFDSRYPRYDLPEFPLDRDRPSLDEDATAPRPAAMQEHRPNRIAGFLFQL